MSLTRWLTLGAVSVAVIAAIVFSLGAVSDAGDASASVVRDSDRYGSVGRGSASTAPATATARAPRTSSEGTPGSPPSGAGSDAPDPVATATPVASIGTSVTPIEAPPVTGELRLRIPALQVDAAVTPLGFDGAGGFAVPTTAGGVGWYEFSAYPGAAGNTVLGGHLNWRGSRGVFDRLDELSLGDMIYVDTAQGQIAYQVVESISVTAQTPFADILGERNGPSTLTLFTCGGTFSTVSGQYDERTVVNAVRV